MIASQLKVGPPYDRSMLCKQCRYSLTGLEARRCPECGATFDPTDPNTFIVPSDPVIRPRRLCGCLTFVILSGFAAFIYWTQADWWAYVGARSDPERWPKFEVSGPIQFIESALVGTAFGGASLLIGATARYAWRRANRAR